MGASGEEAIETGSRLSRQIPSFAAIGLIGYVVDSAVTYFGAKYLHLSDTAARPPGFLIATVVNFALNRAITFRHAQAPLARALLRYFLVAAAGLAVNYAVYLACVFVWPLLGLTVTPEILPLFIAAGAGAAMVLTFVGFRWFAFRP